MKKEKKMKMIELCCFTYFASC